MCMKHESSDNKAAVVFGAQHPTGLITARSLRNCGLQIIGMHFSDSPCLCSNLWTSLIRIEKTADDILEKLNVLTQEKYSDLLLLPADDECVKILSDNRHRLPAGCRLMLPEPETVDLLLDKSQFFAWAAEHGFNFPATSRVRGFKELDEAIAETGYPVLLKPLYRTTVWDREFPQDKVFIVENEEQLRRLPTQLFEVASPLLLQQWIPGGDDGVYFCLVQYSREGRLVNHFCGRKLMQWPPLGGSTAIAISDKLDETRDVTVAIFDAVRYQGLGSMEYKKDPRNGKFYIMEPTVGRNDFQSYLAVSGGVNLTREICREMLGETTTAIARKKSSAWFCEPSVWYGLKYYLRKRNFYLLKHLFRLFRQPGFAYLSRVDTMPFIKLIKSRFR